MNLFTHRPSNQLIIGPGLISAPSIVAIAKAGQRYLLPERHIGYDEAWVTCATLEVQPGHPFIHKFEESDQPHWVWICFSLATAQLFYN